MRRLIVLGAVLAVVVLLAVAQLVLPGLAAQRVRSQLDPYGRVESVSVGAFPAIQLLWQHADSVSVELASFRSAGTGAVDTEFGRLHDVGTLHATVARARIGLLIARDVRLVKHGSTLIAGARVTDADLRRTLPLLQSVTPVAGSGDQLTLRGTAQLLGAPVSVDVSVRVSDGKLVASPDVPLGPIATITLFSDPDVRVDTVGATAVPGGFVVRATATLR